MKKVPRGKRKAPLLPIPTEGAFDRVGNRYIIVFSDYYTRWPEAFALPSIDAPRIAQLIVDEIIVRYSAPHMLLSGCGPTFLATIVQEVCRLITIRRQHTTAYHPQTDGLIDRFNGTLVEGLAMYVSSNQTDWDKHTPMVLFAYHVPLMPLLENCPFIYCMVGNPDPY